MVQCLLKTSLKTLLSPVICHSVLRMTIENCVWILERGRVTIGSMLDYRNLNLTCNCDSKTSNLFPGCIFYYGHSLIRLPWSYLTARKYSYSSCLQQNPIWELSEGNSWKFNYLMWQNVRQDGRFKLLSTNNTCKKWTVFISVYWQLQLTCFYFWIGFFGVHLCLTREACSRSFLQVVWYFRNLKIQRANFFLS